MNKNRMLSNRYVIYTLLVVAGIFVGWMLFHSPRHDETKNETVESHEHTEIWTCAMHPQIRMPDAGKCPLCGMDLILLDQSDTGIDPNAVHFTKEAAALAHVMTSVVSGNNPVKEVRLFGKIGADERLVQNQTAHVPGRIEELMVNFTGERVAKGQVLARIFSPELIVAQQEMLEAAKLKDLQPEIYEASREKLRHWKLTESQISTIENTGMAAHDIEVLSNTTGIVISKPVNTGDHVSEGAVLYQVADLSKVWVLFDAYESDLPFLRTGDQVRFTVQAIPNQEFSGRIQFIDPVIDPVTRVARVRVETGNPGGRLKPEMFVTGSVRSQPDEYRNSLVIPQSAVLWTGKRSVVYVKQAGTNEPVFKMREIELGPHLGNSYVVIRGLSEGEEIVTEGAFSVDAAAQLEGKVSMMNRESGLPVSHHQAVNTGTEMKTTIENPSANMAGSDFKKQLNSAFEKYLVLKDAFIEGNLSAVKHEARNFEKSMVAVDLKTSDEEQSEYWNSIQKVIIRHTTQIISGGTIEKQREAFSRLSDEFYQLLKTYSLSGKTIYYQFCPMALNDKGAYWLSITEDIRNPYFGDQMLTCGETRDTF